MEPAEMMEPVEMGVAPPEAHEEMGMAPAEMGMAPAEMGMAPAGPYEEDSEAYLKEV